MAHYNLEIDEFAMRDQPPHIIGVHNRDNGDTLLFSTISGLCIKTKTERAVKPETALYAAVKKLAEQWLKENA